ncbi:MAG: hypothetical protein AB7I37_10800 [Pirellulales bacterium]
MLPAPLREMVRVTWNEKHRALLLLKRPPPAFAGPRQKCLGYSIASSGTRAALAASLPPGIAVAGIVRGSRQSLIW